MLDLPALYAACAPQVHPRTMDAVVAVESGRRPLALNVNRRPGQARAPRPPQPRSVDEAVAVAQSYLAAGHSVDLGLAQVNSRNLPALGLGLREVLADPCRNLAAGAAILAGCYDRAVQAGRPPGDAALAGALACYNTGSLNVVAALGYVSRYGVLPPPGGGTTGAVTAPPAPLLPPADPRMASMLVAGWEGVIERGAP